LGQSLEKLGMQREAIEHWKQAIRADPNHLGALYNLATILSRLHDPQAQKYLDRFVELQQSEQVTDRVRLLRSLAMEAGKAQNWPMAIEKLQEAIRLCGQCSRGALLHKNLAFFYKTTGQINAAEEELCRAIALDPNDGNARKALAALQNPPTTQPHSP